MPLYNVVCLQGFASYLRDSISGITIQLRLQVPCLKRENPHYLDWYWIVISIIILAGQFGICRLRVAGIKIAGLC